MKNGLFIICLFLISFYSCKDSENLNPEENYFKASVLVEVVDVSGNPVSNVTISTIHPGDSGVFEKDYGTTDGKGVLLLKNIYLFSSTYLTATRTGYFEGSRRFYPVAGKTQFVRIILMNADNAGVIQPSEGGTIKVDNQVTLTFPPDAIVKQDGQPYTGPVTVNVSPIPADDDNLLTKMPGNLVGINESGTQVALGSFGMVAIELRTSWNELLNLKEGQTVEMKMKVPDSKMNYAPSTIPMWYFDETAGYWKEQGAATLIGNEYVAQLPHFSFWNCDYSFNAVEWGATFVYENGKPAQQLYATLTILSLGATTGGMTNEEGFVSGLVPANEKLQLTIFNQCGQIALSEEIGPFKEDGSRQTIVIPSASLFNSTFTGKAVNCKNDPVTLGYVNILGGGTYYNVPLDERTGEFSFTALDCDQPDFIIKVFDLNTFKESQVLSFPFNSVISAGTIQACEHLTELIDLNVGIINQHFLFYFPFAQTDGGWTTMGATDSLQTQTCYFHVPGISKGTFPTDETFVSVVLPSGHRISASNIVVTFFYFGEVGDYITGTISGTFTPSPGAGGSGEYPLTGTFTILRE